MGITAGHAMELLERPGDVVLANDGEAVHFITEIDGELVLNTWVPSISERRNVVIDRDNARRLIVRAGSRDGNTLRRESVDETPFGDDEDQRGLNPRDRVVRTLDSHELPDTCPTCGQEYEQVITITGRYNAKPVDSQAVSIHVVRNFVEERGWDFGIFLHERPALADVNVGDSDGQ